MSNKSVFSDVFVLFDIKKIEEDYDEGLLLSLQEAAEEGARDAERRFRSKHRGTGTGELLGAFGDIKSIYRDGGWLFGAFHRRRGKWVDSVGGRAHFFEYGRSAAGAGRDSTGKPMSIAFRKAFGQRPRPFIRPARNLIKRRLGGITSQELRRVAKRINKSKPLEREIKRAINKI